MTVYGFIGPSGTGKSYRALEVAKRIDVSFILDDGLLIRENQVLAGVSAKREASRIASIRRALYTDQDHASGVRAALDASDVQSIMILGTSANMVDTIAKRLELPPISKYIDIMDVATQSEIDAARTVRATEGKHVIPVPTFALKKEFSGYFLSPLRRLVRRGIMSGDGPSVKTAARIGAQGKSAPGAGPQGKGAAGSSGAGAGGRHSGGDYGERTVVRPTFSYLGSYTISRTALEQLVSCIVLKTEGVVRVLDVNVDFTGEGLDIELSLCLLYGKKIPAILKEAAGRLRYEVDRQTSLHIRGSRLVAKSVEAAAAN